VSIQLMLRKEFFRVIAVVVTLSSFLRSQADLFNAVGLNFVLMTLPKRSLTARRGSSRPEESGRTRRL
jgi:hypothetical protein